MNLNIMVKLVMVVVLLLAFDKTQAQSKNLPEGQILFYQESRQGQGNLVILDLKTGNQQQVGQSGSRPDHFPSWSADGKSIVFESYRKGGWHVWVCDASGKNARRLSNLPDYSTSYYEFDPGFAPDNQTVVFMRGDDLWTVTLANSSPIRLTKENNGIWETAPVFSPDGKKIAFVGYDDQLQQWNIYTLNRDGNEMEQLTKDQGKNFSPTWSPDGKHLLFYSDRHGSFELYELTIDGKNVRAVFDQKQRKSAGFQKTVFVNPWDNNWGATEQYRASYSPDGQWIVFSREIDGDRELFVARRDGSSIRRITNRPGLDGQPSWRPMTKH